MTDRAFDMKVKKLLALQEKVDELKKEMSSLENDVKREMTARNVESIETLKYAASWPLIISNKFDTTAFKRTYGNLYQQFTKPSESRRFTYKAV